MDYFKIIVVSLRQFIMEKRLSQGKLVTYKLELFTRVFSQVPSLKLKAFLSWKAIQLVGCE